MLAANCQLPLDPCLAARRAHSPPLSAPSPLTQELKKKELEEMEALFAEMGIEAPKEGGAAEGGAEGKKKKRKDKNKENKAPEEGEQQQANGKAPERQQQQAEEEEAQQQEDESSEPVDPAGALLGRGFARALLGACSGPARGLLGACWAAG